MSFKASLMASASAFAVANATALFHGLYDIKKDRYFSRKAQAPHKAAI